MLDTTNFDYLFAESERMSPDIDDEDLIIHPIPSQSSTLSSIPYLSSQKLRFISQNVMKSHVVTHSLLNIASFSPFSADIILIQEPWYGRIGIDVITGKTIFGTPSHRDWMCILSIHRNHTPH